MENKFKSGDIVCAKVNPTTPLKVRVFARKFYYCDVLDQPDEKEKVYFAHKNKCDGICIEHRDAYGIEEGIDDINYYVDKINSDDTTNPWIDYILNRCDYINEQVK